MLEEVNRLKERMRDGGDWRTFQQEVASLHARASTFDEYNEVLAAHQALRELAVETFDTETLQKILPIMRSEYLMFLNTESMEHGVVNPVLLDKVTAREVATGRMDADDDFRKLAEAGAQVLGDSAELYAHKCKQGDWLFYGAAAAVLLTLGMQSLEMNPLWLIPAALGAGWYINDKERRRIKAEIAATR